MVMIELASYLASASWLAGDKKIIAKFIPK